MKTFSLSKVLYKQHMCDIFEVLWCFYCKYERTQNIDICFFKAPWIYFPKTVKYLDRFTSIMKINKPFKRIGQGQTDIRFPASSEGYQTYLEWEDSSPNLIQRPLAYFYILGWHFLIPFISYLKSNENHCQICLHLRNSHGKQNTWAWEEGERRDRHILLVGWFELLSQILYSFVISFILK